MLEGLNIAVVGCTGAVGATFFRILEQRYTALPRVRALASSRSAGKRLSLGSMELLVEETTEESFAGVDIAFISVSSDVSRRFAPAAVAAGAVVIDDSSAFRMMDDVPLVAPEVNGADVEWHKGTIAIPNCSTTPLVMAAHPLHQVNQITRMIVDTYQSVSGAGGGPVEELREQSRDLLEGREARPRALDQQIAFNLIPRIDSFLDDGYTFEEQKVRNETRKIMHAPDIQISATCVRVPVYVSHSAAVHMEFDQPMAPEEARRLLSAMPGVTVVDNPAHSVYPMPWDAAGTDDVFVGRIRQDASNPKGLVMWIVSDNLRKGAALNSIQIAEELVSRGCLKPKVESGAID